VQLLDSVDCAVLENGSQAMVRIDKVTLLMCRHGYQTV
jgi:hypothetical protein